MALELTLDVLYKQQLIFSGDLSSPIELGRLKSNETRSQLCVKQPTANGFRVAIVERGEASVSREHVLVERVGESRLRLTNLSKTSSIRAGREMIGIGESREINIPATFFLGETAEVRVEEPPELQSLAPSSLKLGALGLVGDTITVPVLELPDAQAEPIVEWMESIVAVLQSAVSSTDFYQQAAKAMVKLVGLDSGRVLMRIGQGWDEQAQEFSSSLSDQGYASLPSSQILGSLLRDKRTVWSDSGSSSWDSQKSLRDIQAVVAAPIVDRRGEVIGALYGDRLTGIPGATNFPQITKVEAMLVKILAASVAAGLARVESERLAKEQEQKAAAARTLFGQFFTPELSDRLAADPDMLKGRDTEVTLLFCDIRDFSGISERLDPAVTVNWIGDVIGVLSDCVINHQGVLVDYIGDELLAMWGAPSEQPDQALLACRAALAMRDALPVLNKRWEPHLKAPFSFGIGINTGIARVGNTGSKQKLKYGPLGNTVNLASRVRGMTKYLGSEILITAATKSRLNLEFATRRLCKVRVVNIVKPVDLHELRPLADEHWNTLREGYEEALQDFEQQKFRKAAGVLSGLISKYPQDQPSLVLLSRAVDLLISGAVVDASWDAAWVPPGK